MSVGAIAATLISTRHGPGISPDPAVYVSTARHLAAGQGLVAYDHSLLTQWPPGFPAVLAAGETIGVGAMSTARLANAAACGALVLLGFLLLRRHVLNPVLLLLATAVIAVSPTVLRMSSMALTEPLFAVLVLLLILLLERLSQSESARLVVMGAALVCWAAFMLRYAGIALVATGALVIATAPRTESIRTRLIRALAFGLFAMVVPVAWMARNLAEGTALFGERGSATRGLLTNTRDAVDAVASWILPGAVPEPVRVAALLLVAFAVALALWKMPRDSSLLALGAYLSVYSAYMIASASITDIDKLNERLLFPILVPVLVLLTYAVDLALASPRFSYRWIRVAGLAAFGLWFLWPAGTYIKTAYDRSRDGSGYEGVDWEASPLARDVRRLPPSARLSSNMPDALYIAADRDSTFTPSSTKEAVGLAHAACRHAEYLAWYSNSSTPRDWLLTPEQLRSHFRLVRVHTDSDGTLYRVSSRRASGASCAA